MNRTLRTLGWTLAALAAFPSFLFLASMAGLFPWSPLNCQHHEVDIYSGRIRHTRYVFWMRIRESVEDSALTKALAPEDLDGVNPEWHRALTFSPGYRHSPHYLFHSAIYQIRDLERAWKLVEFTS